MIEYDTLKYTDIEVSNDLLASFEEEGFTYLHCTYITSPKFIGGWWVNIHKTSFLVGGNNEKLEMLHAMNIPLAPERHYLKKFGDYLQFTLIFPKIPASWKVFDFVEECISNDGLTVRNIPRNSTGAYSLVVK
jgi:hypothetical protein